MLRLELKQRKKMCICLGLRIFDRQSRGDFMNPQMIATIDISFTLAVTLQYHYLCMN